MNFSKLWPASLLFSAFVGTGNAHDDGGPAESAGAPASGKFQFISGEDWASGSDVSLGGIFFPGVHLSMAFGASSGDPEALAAGHHDPNREGITVQNLEFGMELRAGKHVEGFITYAGVVDQEDRWLGSVEEAFGRLKDLPGGFELRAGRYYNRFGFYNSLHPHDYEFVNRDLLEARMLGEDAVTSEGGEVAWNIPGNTRWSGAMALSYGRVFLEEEEVEEPEDSLFPPEGALFSHRLFSADARVVYHHTDFHQWTGLVSCMSGENAYGRETEAWVVGLEYQWSEKGYEPGGRSLRCRTELVHRRAGAVSNAAPGEQVFRQSLDETGLSAAAVYEFNDKFRAGMGVAWVGGIGAADLSGRCRISPMVQWNLADKVNLRLQYDHDTVTHSGSENSVWIQANVSWGPH